MYQTIHSGKLGETMISRFLTVIGVTYVAIIAVVAAFCIFDTFDDVGVSKGEASQLAAQTQRVNHIDRGLPYPQRLPATPEYVDGKPAKYRIGKDGDETKTKTPKKQEAYITVSNYLVIWTADWCPYCPKMKALGGKLEAEGFHVIYLDLDDNREEAKRLGITRIPTAIVYDSKVEVLRLTGMGGLSESQIRAVLRKDTENTDNYDIYNGPTL